MIRLTSLIAIQRNVYDGQAKACWGVIQVGYTRLMFRKPWFRDQNQRPTFWLRLWSPMQRDSWTGYHRRWCYLNVLGVTLFNINPDRGYCGR